MLTMCNVPLDQEPPVEQTADGYSEQASMSLSDPQHSCSLGLCTLSLALLF